MYGTTLAAPTVALHALAADLLVRRQAAFRGQGIELRQQLRPVIAMGDPSGVFALLSAALDWAGGPGMRLFLSVEANLWPVHALVRLRAYRAVRLAGEAPAPVADGPLWERMQATAAAVGAPWRLEPDERHIDLLLTLPGAGDRHEALSALDMEDFSASRAGGPGDSRRFAGKRTLLVTDDGPLQDAVRAACLQLDLAFAGAPTTRDAVRWCEQSPPDLIVLDAQLHDDIFRQLHGDLLHETVRFPVVEVARGSTVIGQSSGEGASLYQIGRDDVRRTLPDALALALSR